MGCFPTRAELESSESESESRWGRIRPTDGPRGRAFRSSSSSSSGIPPRSFMVMPSGISSSSLDVGGTGPLTPLDVEAERGLGSTYSLPLLRTRFAAAAASATVVTWREGRGVFEGVLRCSSKSHRMPPGVARFFDCFAGGLGV